MEGQQNRQFETHAYVLSVVPPKEFLRDSRPRGDTVIQGIGESHFTLLEMIPQRGAMPNPQERVSIERNVPSKIDHVRRRIFYEDLTPESVTELPLVIEMLVTKHEHRYVQFFNEAAPITTRMHSLQLLPGIGQTLMWAILEERKREPFKSFEDIASRTKLQNPKKVMTARIIDELREDVKRWLFVRPPKRDEDERDQRDRSRPPRR
jgi:putative nucleotide binding protein